MTNLTAKWILLPSLIAVLALPSAAAFAVDASLPADPVYQKNCAKCHGKTAEGRHFGGPSLVSAAVKSMSAEDLRQIITNGRHRMPKYEGKLTPEQIDTLVQQIKGDTAK